MDGDGVGKDLSRELRGSGWLKTSTRSSKKEIVPAATVMPAPAEPSAGRLGSPCPSIRGFELQLKEEDALHDLMLLASHRSHHVLEPHPNAQEAMRSFHSLHNNADVREGIESDDYGESSPNKRPRSSETHPHPNQMTDEVVEGPTPESNTNRSRRKKRRELETWGLDTLVITAGGRIIGPNLAVLPPHPRRSSSHKRCHYSPAAAGAAASSSSVAPPPPLLASNGCGGDGCDGERNKAPLNLPEPSRA